MASTSSVQGQTFSLICSNSGILASVRNISQYWVLLTSRKCIFISNYNPTCYNLNSFSFVLPSVELEKESMDHWVKAESTLTDKVGHFTDDKTEAHFFFLINYVFIYLFLAVLGLRCCTRAFSSRGEQGLLFVAVHGLPIAVASLVVEHRL